MGSLSLPPAAFAPAYPPCRHCKKRPGRRRRGLCWMCYKKRHLRKRYPPLSNRGRRPGQGQEFIGPATIPIQPTPAQPHSDEKIRELERRVIRRWNLWHPEDGERAFYRLLEHMKLPDRLTYVRRRSNLSREDLARQIGMDPRFVRFFEAGERVPTWPTLLKIGRACSVDAEALRAG